jgi:hypothetical protein
MAQTDRLGLPLLAAGQAQKEVTHNEALALLDMTVQPVVESADIAVPPASPALGQCWIVAIGGTGAWLGHDGALAGWTAAGWMLALPLAGWQAWAVDRESAVRFDGSTWVDEPARADGFYLEGERIVGTRQPAIAAPSGGAVQDGEARTAIATILTTLRNHGLIET